MRLNAAGSTVPQLNPQAKVLKGVVNPASEAKNYAFHEGGLNGDGMDLSLPVYGPGLASALGGKYLGDNGPEFHPFLKNADDLKFVASVPRDGCQVDVPAKMLESSPNPFAAVRVPDGFSKSELEANGVNWKVLDSQGELLGQVENGFPILDSGLRGSPASVAFSGNGLLPDQDIKAALGNTDPQTVDQILGLKNRLSALVDSSSPIALKLPPVEGAASEGTANGLSIQASNGNGGEAKPGVTLSIRDETGTTFRVEGISTEKGDTLSGTGTVFVQVRDGTFDGNPTFRWVGLGNLQVNVPVKALTAG